MWRRPRLTKSLPTIDEELLLDAAGMIADDLADEMRGAASQTFYGVGAFDDREPEQRLRLLSDVVSWLVGSKISLARTVFTDGTVFAIVSRAADMVRQEIDSELREGAHPAIDTYSWRRTAWPCVASDRSGPTSLESADAKAWTTALDALAHRIIERGSGEPERQNDVCAAQRSEAVGSSTEPRTSDRQQTADATEVDRLWRRLRRITHSDSLGAR